MIDQDMETRLRRLAKNGADLARVPGAEQAIRRGRRRRRHLAGVTALLLVAALAGGARVQALLDAPPVMPATPAPKPRLRPGLPPSALPGRQPTFKIVRSAAGKVRVEGTWRQFRWHYDIWNDTESPLPRDPAARTWRSGDWLELDNGAGGGGSGFFRLLRRVGTTCCEYPVDKPRPPDPVLEVFSVTNRAAVVRITFQLRGKPIGPVDFRPVDAGPGLPIGIVALERYPDNGDMVLREIVLLDRDGARICQQRFDKDGHFNWKASQPDPCSS